MRKTRILLTISDLRGGGAEREFVNLVGALPRDRYDPHLCFWRTTFTYPVPEDTPYRVLHKTRPWHVFRTIARFRDLVGELRPDVVFSQLHYVNMVTGAALARIRDRPRWVCRQVNDPRREMMGPFAWWARRALAHANIVNMLMATSVVGLGLVLALALWRGDGVCSSPRGAFLLAAVLLPLGIYTFLRFDTPVNYYASRYFLPVFVPATMLLYGELLAAFRVRRAWILGLALVGLGFNLPFDRALYLCPGYPDEMRFVEDVAARVGRADMLIGMHLHSLVLATAQGTPSVGIGFDMKVGGFMRYLGEGDRHVPIRGLRTETLRTMAESCWSDRDAIRRRLDARMGEWRGLVEESMADVRAAIGGDRAPR